MKKQMTIDEKEAKAIVKLIDEGMPDEQKKRDFIARLYWKIKKNLSY